jgi:ribosomal-protein-alanine N-acetyltransferase
MQQIKTERLILKSLSDCDSERLISIFKNEEVANTFMVPDLPDEGSCVNLFNRIKALSNSEDKFVYGIYLDDKLIGIINEVFKDTESIELGYVIDPSHKNNGYATEALKASITALFSLGYNRVMAGAFEGNVASNRVMEKAGMKFNGAVDVVEYRGVTHHCKMYSIEK